MNHPNQRPILCGTDFSEAAAKAANVAAAMAVRLDAPLVLVHGVDEHGEMPASYWPAMMEALRSQLHDEAGRLRRTGARVEEVMAGGAPDDGVANTAERADARFIVVGSTGHGALARWTLGSVSEHIAESAWVPTLVLQETTRLEDWARGGKPLRVFVGADFTPNSEAALSWAAGLREIGPCEFTVGFVDLLAAQRAEQVARGGEGTPLAPEMHEMLKYDLRERVSSYFQKEAVHVRVLPTSGRADTHLLDMAAEAGAELIVIGTHQWHGLNRLRHSSVSRRILHAARTNVACVPAHHVVSAFSPCFSKAHRVLVATDLSTHDGSAILYAFSALQLGGTVWLLHVAGASDNQAAKLAELRQLIPAEAVAQGFKVEVEVVTDTDPAKAICDAADRLDVDLLCIGSRGPCKRTAALGDTTLAVLTRSTRPVLVVPQNHF
ncbi:MAG: universal stress protein [Chthoniobacter sp.]|nr:universal stress protein [Chthoniobacter sp.]